MASIATVTVTRNLKVTMTGREECPGPEPHPVYPKLGSFSKFARSWRSALPERRAKQAAKSEELLRVSGFGVQGLGLGV